ncbi:aminomethyl-transferring glycine dehydrogenase [bacterium]|nr:aminomethyl-transferring glycine dehydrogenase [bacterium]
MNSEFKRRHIGPGPKDTEAMLKAIGVQSLEQLINETIPEPIRLKQKMSLPAAISERQLLDELKQIAAKNQVFKSYIGMGYYDCITPTVILRNIFENPSWYTQYTPYQAEISQGRLEALLNYQTMIMDMTGMEIANASLLDEGTAAAEAMHMFYASKADGSGNKFFVSQECFPQTIEVLKTRAIPLDIELVIGDHRSVPLSQEFFGALVQYPAGNGAVYNYTDFCKKAHDLKIYVVAAADLLALALLTPPGEWGADTVVGSSQRFGIPMGYGGPHAAFFATKDEFKRKMPGRIIGVTIDAQGNRALRMALQTREQHIRREKATSNICTAQVLLANMAGMYAVYHGPEGIKTIATRVHQLTKVLEAGIQKAGYKQLNEHYFDTLTVDAGAKTESIRKTALDSRINLRYIDAKTIGISVDETTESSDVQKLIDIFSKSSNASPVTMANPSSMTISLPAPLIRKSAYLQHPVFNTYHSETEMLRYIKSLELKDLSLANSMIALGSCTMKLNATTEMIPVSWAEFGGLHPFVPQDQAKGYEQIFRELNEHLNEITGFAATSLQPNAGAQGEYAGLLVIREYFKHRGEVHRNIALIPSSAHGTNPASAVMAGFQVVVVQCDDHGNIEVSDLKQKAEQHKNNLAALMVTYPSTHGVFEEAIIDICKIIHDNGGQVYMDGANMNAQVGLTNPAMIGADVCHLNLHKTFCIPHGGGGPGMGPICVAKHLAPFLPGHPVIKIGGEKAMTPVSAAPWGSASILLISYAYIRMMGTEGLTDATKYAILNANYIMARLKGHYDALYIGKHGRVAHEMIVDPRKFKISAGVDVIDIAKRLMDYGFHAPTVSFPVAGTLMIEPTESEPKPELDRFCDALIAIQKEIEEIESGKMDKEDNVLKNAPHTADVIIKDDWKHAYPREKAAFPLAYLRHNKFWPSVGRVNDAHGDRNLICSCPPIEEYMN